MGIRKTIKCDVAVIGGGCAGIGAALAAARNGAKTLLVERAPFAGGIITAVGLPYFDGMMDKSNGRFVVKGIALDLLIRLGIAKPGATSAKDCRSDVITKGHINIVLPNIEEFKRAADDLILQQNGELEVLYHSMACDVEVKDQRIAAVLIANKDGLVRVEAKQFVDSTGDADIAAWAGCPIEKSNPLMPMTIHFRIGNVKPQREMYGEAKRVLAELRSSGELPEYYGPGIIFAFAKDEAYIHACRVPGDASVAADLTRAEIQSRHDAELMFREWKRQVPGFENSYYIASGPYTGVRETRRIVGEQRLTVEDLRRGIRYDDAIATGSWYVDIHPPYTTTNHPHTGDGFQPKPYDISYRTLVPQAVANLLVAGRCHSATKEAAASSRVTVTAMALGEAAGCGAALATKTGEDVATLSGVKVRETLAQQNAGPFTDA